MGPLVIDSRKLEQFKGNSRSDAGRHLVWKLCCPEVQGKEACGEAGLRGRGFCKRY